jgi:hypothetical protein
MNSSSFKHVKTWAADVYLIYKLSPLSPILIIYSIVTRLNSENNTKNFIFGVTVVLYYINSFSAGYFFHDKRHFDWIVL